jgi:hypothetical protein
MLCKYCNFKKQKYCIHDKRFIFFDYEGYCKKYNNIKFKNKYLAYKHLRKKSKIQYIKFINIKKEYNTNYMINTNNKNDESIDKNNESIDKNNKHDESIDKNNKHDESIDKNNKHDESNDTKNKDLENVDKNNVNYNLSQTNIIKYKFLFNKYLLKLENPDKEISYNIIKENKKISNYKLFCNLHCYNIDKFDEIYLKYIKKIQKYFFVIVTYSKGIKKISDNDITILKIENKGMDIGGKIIFIKYLKDKNINYTNLLFLHSKSNAYKRKLYFNPLIKNLDLIIPKLNAYELVIPKKFIHDGNDCLYKHNLNYYNEYNKYMKFKHFENKFIEGNCFFISKKLINKILPYNKLKIFYNILNNKNSFDLNWIYRNYSLKNNNFKFNSSEKIFKMFQESKIRGNLLDSRIKSKTNLRDGCIEHLFERLWINTCKNINGKYLVVR